MIITGLYISSTINNNNLIFCFFQGANTLLCQFVNCQNTLAKLGGDFKGKASLVPSETLKELVPSLKGDGEAKWELLFDLKDQFDI